MTRSRPAVLTALAFGAIASVVIAQQARNDYSDGKTWLCRPGRQDACGVDRALIYNDVLDAWNYYLQHDNGGRGVVLIGHSQGSTVLTQLIRNEIDGRPVQSRLVSALLLGANLAVPNSRDVGGAFKHVPL